MSISAIGSAGFPKLDPSRVSQKRLLDTSAVAPTNKPFVSIQVSISPEAKEAARSRPEIFNTVLKNDEEKLSMIDNYHNNFTATNNYDASTIRIQKSIAFSEISRGISKLYSINSNTMNTIDLNLIKNKIPNDTESKRISWGDVSMNLSSANNGQPIHIEDLSRIADMALQDSKIQLDAAFTNNHILNNPVVDISFDLMGKIIIGDHPEKNKIEDLFKNNPELENDIRTAYCLKENAVSLEKASLYNSAYYKAYQSKGIAAANKMTDIFLSLSDPKTTMKYSQSGLSTLFNGLSTKDYLQSIAKNLGVDEIGYNNIG